MVNKIRTEKLNEYKKRYGITPQEYNEMIKEEVKKHLEKEGKLIDKVEAERIVDLRIEMEIT